MAIQGKKLQYWTRHFEEWQASGLARRAYCAREGVSLSTFDHWRRQSRLRAQSETAQAPVAAPPQALTLVPVQLNPAGGDIQLRSPSGWHITLPATLGADALADLLSRLP